MNVAFRRCALVILCTLVSLPVALAMGKIRLPQDIGGGVTAPLGEPKTGLSVIEAMRGLYHQKWYKTATFTQITTRFEKDGSRKASISYGALSTPGKLRIDFDPLATKGGLLFARNHVYSFKGGKLDNSRFLLHPQLVLGSDMYIHRDWISLLRGLVPDEVELDLLSLRQDKWQGRPVYVLGSKSATDTRSPQLWIDKGRLYAVRLLRPTDKDGASMEEIQFNEYQRLSGAGSLLK